MQGFQAGFEKFSATRAGVQTIFHDSGLWSKLFSNNLLMVIGRKQL